MSKLEKRNRNILTTSKVKHINLPDKKIYWPRLEITVWENGTFGDVKYITNLNLIECFLKENSKEVLLYEIALGIKKKTNEIINEEIRKQKEKEEEEAKGLKFDYKKKQGKMNRIEEEDEFDEEGYNSEMNEQEDERRGLSQYEHNRNRISKNGKMMEDDEDTEASKTDNVLSKRDLEVLERSKLPNVYFEENEILNSQGQSLRSVTVNGIYNGFEIQSNVNEKKEEKNERKQEIMNLKSLLDKLDPNDPKYREKKNKIRGNIRKIMVEFMTEKKFFGYKNINNEDAFNYGREVIQGSLDDRLELPYKKMELRKIPNFSFGQKFEVVNNFAITGVFQGGILKGGAYLRLSYSERNDDLLLSTQKKGKSKSNK